jgi:hypothetical protein
MINKNLISLRRAKLSLLASLAEVEEAIKSEKYGIDSFRQAEAADMHADEAKDNLRVVFN